MKVQKQQVLKDHKRDKKIYIPPLRQLDIQLDDWKDVKLPEVLWIGIIQSKVGIRMSNDLLLSLADVVDGIYPKDVIGKPNLPGLTSTYQLLPQEYKDEIVETLHKLKILDILRNGLSELVYFYPSSPFSFLFASSQYHFSPKAMPDLNIIKGVLHKMFYRHNKESIFAIMTVLQMAGKRLQMTEEIFDNFNLSIQHLNEVLKNGLENVAPEHCVRIFSTFSGMFMLSRFNATEDLLWPKYFWDRGYELEKCGNG